MYIVDLQQNKPKQYRLALLSIIVLNVIITGYYLTISTSLEHTIKKSIFSRVKVKSGTLAVCKYGIIKNGIKII